MSVNQCGGTPLAPDAQPAVVMWDLNAQDAEGARRFYADLFDWKVGPPSHDQVHLSMVACGEDGIQGVIGQAPHAGEEGTRHSGLIFYVKVHNVQASLERVVRLGGRVIWGPKEVAPGFTLAHFEDPQGIRLGL